MNLCLVNPDQLPRIYALLYKAGVPVNVIGSVGVGKTTSALEFIKRLNDSAPDKDYHLWKVILSTKEPTDIGGFPQVVDGKIKFIPDSTLPFNSEEHGVILADESDRAREDTKNAWLQILLGGEIHGNVISPNAFIIQTMNGSSDTFTREMSEAERTRCCHIYVSRNADGFEDSYDKWAANNGVSQLMRAFKKYRSETIQAKDDFEDYAIRCDRTDDMADRIYQASCSAKFKTDDILLPCLSGCITKPEALEFLAMRDAIENAPSVDEILADPEHAMVPPNESVLYFVANSLLSIAGDVQKAEASLTYATRMPDELAAFTIKQLGIEQPKLLTNPKYIEWMNKHSVIVG